MPNGSFEDFYSCPDNTQQVDSCKFWHEILNTPDYFVSCSPWPVSVPINVCGDQLPFQGNAYVGIITYDHIGFYREILGSKLSDTMTIGATYYISIRVSRGNWTDQAWNTIASNKLGIRFTTFEHTISSPPSINNYANVFCDTIITDTLNWVLLQWSFMADSSYTHLYIGNFFDDANTDTVIINAPNGNEFRHAYYFIDSVNVICSSPVCLTSIQTSYATNDPLLYSSDEYLIIEIPPHISGKFYLINLLGQIINFQNISGKSKLNMQMLPKGIYVAKIVTSQKSFSIKFVNH